MASGKNDLVLGTWLVDRVNLFFRVRRYLKWIGERWMILVACVVLSLGFAIYKAVTSPNIYRATSKIGIAPRIQTGNANQSQYFEELNNFYDSQLQYMSSALVLSKVDEKTREQRPTAEGFELGYKAVKGPASFTLQVESTDLPYASLFSKVWADEFINFKNEMRGTAIGKSQDSVRDEISGYERNLEQARAALLAFQRENNIGSIKETGDAAQTRLDKNLSDYQEVKTLRQRLESRLAEELASSGDIDRLQNTAEKQPTADGKKDEKSADPLARFESSRYSELKFQLLNKEAEKARLGTTLKPKHPYMVRLQMEINQNSQELAHHLEMIEEKRVARIRSLKSDEESYKPIIADLTQQVLSSRKIQYEFERLRDEETSIKLALDTLRKTEQSLKSTSSDEGYFNVLEAGVGSPLPVRPNRPRIVLTGLVVGVGLGLALIYFLGRLDDRVELAEEVERELEFPILGQVPLVDLKGLKQDRVLITKLDKHNMFSEAIRGVRSALFLGVPDTTKKQALIVTSAAPGDGKTTITTNFAMTLALAGQSVLLIDGDLRRGNVHNYFGGKRENGFSEVLSGAVHWSDVVRDTDVPTMHYMSSGSLVDNPGELLISPVTAEFLAQARDGFDYIVFDCPPLTAIDDTFSLAGLVDGLLFVVMSGQTSMRFAKNALTAAQRRGANVFGVILNGIRPDNPYHYYQQYYYTYYSATAPGEELGSAPTARRMAAPSDPNKFRRDSAARAQRKAEMQEHADKAD